MKKRMKNIFLEGFFNRGNNQYYFEDKDGWIALISAYLLIHVFLEGIYLYSYCFPMIYINLVSIVIYLFEYYLNDSGYEKAKLWLGVSEIYLHIVLGTIFMGYDSGFWFWLFAMVLAVITPYFMPVFTKAQNLLTNISALIFVATFLLLSYMNFNDLLPNRYNAPDNIATFLFYFNAILAFAVIIVYSAIYSVSIKNNNEKLLQMINQDYLTGLHNRQYIQKKLSSRISSKNIKNISIAIMDIDYFKKVNDLYGHQTGDYVLKEISKILLSKKNLHIGRWGGEEFLIVSYSNTGYAEFCSIINDLCKEIADHIFTHLGCDLKVTASFGAASISDGMNLEGLIKLADSRLYYAKEHGRNSVISA